MRTRQRLSHLHSHPLFPHVLSIIEKLHSRGFEALLAGGCVRDAIMGRTPQDFDIATSATPADVEELFTNTLAVGKEFGVIVVIVDSKPFEVASFRFDGPYIDGRRPQEVSFTNAEEDAKRRDFTMNALFYDPVRFEVLDYVGGQKDISDHLIRTVGNPVDRFREDKLRMLRAVRFVAQTGFAMDDLTHQAIRAHAAEISVVSAERIFQEMRKLLGSVHWRSGVELLSKTNLSKQIWPEMNLNTPAHLPSDEPLNWEQSFALVMWWSAAQGHCEKRLNSWKAPKDSIRKVQAIISGVERLMEPSTSNADQMRVLGGEYFAEILYFCKIFLTLEHVEELISKYLNLTGATGQLPPPFVSGDDLLQEGFQSNKELGQILKRLYDEQLEGKIASKTEAIRKAKAIRSV